VILLGYYQTALETISKPIDFTASNATADYLDFIREYLERLHAKTRKLPFIFFP
jgi:hypothetical protein